ncbi:ABC transporter substrate-binding protein [Agrobacterium vitis]|uniref:ABC transporter substrate-binding protein n=1 Tax=Agrobacterium vitis TaxID=373 RepID=UPI0015DB4D62|nr:ABC transporter substrate-binding protein [Agrobacterium vitis]MCF1451353.1 ABC transporter substrate-binding protein [Agrobacterium vitis]BCH53641.1 ABC transporter substrate-binding protein [Agrobacterium vitis]
MTFRMIMRALVALLPFMAAPTLAAEITDVAGRTVTLDLPAKRVLVGEARQIHTIAALAGDKTFDTIVGWRDDMVKKDPDSYAAYVERFPEIAKLPQFGYLPQGGFSLEAAIALHPDVMTLNLEVLQAARESGLEEKAAAAGIQVVYVDFRLDPDKNTEKSIEILGQIFGAEDKAKELIAYRRQQIAVVTDRLAAVKDLKRPNVFMERAPGNDAEGGCCRTFGPANFGQMIEISGGHNIASDIISTTFGEISIEQLIASDPAQIIVTGSNWLAESKTNRFVHVGRGADPAKARAKLQTLIERTGFDGLAAVRNRQVHAAWHQFYGVPYEFVPIQQFAKWFHPELFADLDPDRTFREFHQKFLPVAYKPGYFVSMNPSDDEKGSN